MNHTLIIFTDPHRKNSRVIHPGDTFIPHELRSKEEMRRSGGSYKVDNLHALVLDCEPNAYSFIFNDQETIIKGGRYRPNEKGFKYNKEVVKRAKREDKKKHGKKTKWEKILHLRAED